MDTSSLTARIDHLLKKETPPYHVLKDVIAVLTRARGGGTAGGMAAAPAEVPATCCCSYHQSSASIASSSTSAGQSATSATPDENGMSLPLGLVGDLKHQRYLARHKERVVVPPVDVRAKKTRQYQAYLEGHGSKVVHNDFVKNGATQIGGAASCTPSMTAAAGAENEMSSVADALGRGNPPRARLRHKEMSGVDFRVC